MAQWIAHQTSNLGVAGSIPVEVALLTPCFVEREREREKLNFSALTSHKIICWGRLSQIDDLKFISFSNFFHQEILGMQIIMAYSTTM